MRKGWNTIAIVAGLFLLALVLTAGFFASLKHTEEVVVASRALPVGARIREGDVTLKELHASAVLEGALASVEDAIGQVLSVPRLPGEQITADMLGEESISSIAATLPPGHLAMAVKVNRVTGLAGAVQEGSRVTLIGILEPQEAVGMMAIPTTPGETVPITVRSPVALVALRNVKVLLVPRDFRYQEVLPTEEEGFWAPAVTTVQQQNESAILVDVPLEPVELYPGGPGVSPATLVALVNAYGSFHLAMEPAAEGKAEAQVVPSLDLYTLYETALRLRNPPTPTPTPKAKKARPTSTPAPKGGK